MRLAFLLLASALHAQIVIAHRGGKAQAPENTMAAFRTAVANGVKALELDVVLSQDGYLVVHHDLALNSAICRGAPRGPISLLTLRELWKSDCGDSRYPGQRPPVLEEVLELAQHAKATLMVETKMAHDGESHFVKPERVVEAIAAAAERYGMADQIWLQSFDHRTLTAMKRRNAAVKLVMLNPHVRQDDYVRPAQSLGAYAQFINFRVIEKRDVEVLHRAGIRAFSGTTSDPAEWRRLKHLDVDAILTDDPLGLLRQ
jgi:glycerophosphoryl diester phosphodiesterase